MAHYSASWKMRTRTFEALKYLSRFRMQVMYNDVDLELIYFFGFQFKRLSKHRHIAKSMSVPFLAEFLFGYVHNEQRQIPGMGWTWL